MKQVVLVELDAIVDTRLGTLAKLNLQSAKDALKSDYWDREVNDFSKLPTPVSEEDFNEAYKKRDVETLKLSIMTNMVLFLVAFIKKLERAVVEHPLVSGLELHLNVYPYVMSKELEDAFAANLRAYVGELADVQVVNIPLKELGPYALKSKYSTLFLYNYHEWHGYHHNDFVAGKRVIECDVMAPRLYESASNLPTTEEDKYVESGGYKLDGFQAYELIVKEFYGLTFLPASYYSIIPPGLAEQIDDGDTPSGP